MSEYGQRRLSVILTLTDAQITELVRLVFHHKNKNERWNEFKDHDLRELFHEKDRGITFTKTDFLCSQGLEATIRNFFIYEEKPPAQNNLDAFRTEVQKKISSTSSSRSFDHSPYSVSDPDYSSWEKAGSVFGYLLVGIPMVLVVIGIISIFNTSDDGSRNADNERFAMESCKNQMTRNINLSCSADPVFSFCSLNYEPYEILGSGCTSRIKSRGTISEQIEYCKTETLPTVNRACAIEVYGEAAVTGRVSLR